MERDEVDGNLESAPADRAHGRLLAIGLDPVGMGAHVKLEPAAVLELLVAEVAHVAAGGDR